MIAILVNSMVLLALCALVYRQNKSQALSLFFLPALGLKLLAGVALGLLYFYYYGYGDTEIYFSDASILADVFYKTPVDYLNFLAGNSACDLYYHDNPRALVFVKFISPLAILTFKNYWLTSLYLSLLSFLGSWYFVKSIHAYYKQLTNGAILGFLFFPSVVFWGSGILKESVSVAILSVLAAWFMQFINNSPKVNRWKIIAAAFLLFILYSLKYYYAAAFLLAVVPTIMLHSISRKTQIKYTIFSWSILLMLVVVVVSGLHPNLHLRNVANVIVENNRLYEEHYFLAKTIRFYKLEPTFWSLLWNAPIALASAWFRPLFVNATSILQMLLSVENMMLIILFAFFIIRKRSLAKENLPIILSWILFIVVLSVLLPISTPNFGTLSRYRVSFLPYFIMLISYNNAFINRLFNPITKIQSRKS